MRDDHLNKLADNNIIIYLSVGVFLVVVFLSFRFIPVIENISNHSLILPNQDLWKLSPLLCNVINTVIILFCALLLQRMNSIFALIRSRTLFPLLFFLLLEGSNPSLTSTLNLGNLLSFILILSLFTLFSSYQKEQTQRHAFGLSLYIGFGTLFWSPFIYLMPIFWIGMYQMRSLTGKTFVATLLGLITVGWLILSAHWIFGITLYSENLFVPLSENHIYELQCLNYTQLLYIFPTIVLGIISIINNLYNNFNDKTRTRAYNGFINILLIVAIIAIIIHFNESNIYLPVLNTCIALQAAHFFTNTKNKPTIVLFYIILTLYFLLFLWNLLQD